MIILKCKGEVYTLIQAQQIAICRTCIKCKKEVCVNFLYLLYAYVNDEFAVGKDLEFDSTINFA
jgi:hypothetical protein